MRLLLAANNQPTRRNEIIKSYLKTGFKQQPICTPLAPIRNKIIYKTACSDGPKSFSKPASLKRASLVLGAGKTRSLVVLLIALSCELEDFLQSSTSWRKPLLIKSVTLAPTLKQFGRLLSHIEEAKEKHTPKIDVRCNDRNKLIASKRILVATGGSATAEMSMRYSNFSQWL